MRFIIALIIGFTTKFYCSASIWVPRDALVVN